MPKRLFLRNFAVDSCSFRQEKNIQTINQGQKMKVATWIGGIIGFMSGGALGALAGAAIGAVVDTLFDGKGDASNRISSGDGNTQYDDGRRDSFLFSMLVLAAYIIKADGKIMHSEMEFVRNMLRANFGESAVTQGESILHNLFREQDLRNRYNPNAYKETIRQCCMQMDQHLTMSERLQMLNFLVLIAQADGYVSPEEIAALKEVASFLGLSEREVDSMLNLKGDSVGDAYKILEISPDATNDEVRAAYRRLALKHHPDRVATLGEDVRRAAEKKLQQINDAKERIYKSRGM